jgi:hypothetical protein
MNVPTVLVLTLSREELRTLLQETISAALDTRVMSQAATVSPLLDKRELARRLAVSPATITRLVQEGAPHTFVGSSPRFDVEAFRAWLDARGRQRTKAKPSNGPIAGVRLLSKPRAQGAS